MKRTSIRLRLMVLMICLTTLPVITVTWIATNNTQKSVEKEIINANISRIMWSEQYLNELIQQIQSLFYTLQTNKQLINGLNDIDSPDVGIQFRTQKYTMDTLYSVFCANYRKVNDLTLYIHSNQKAFSVSFATSVTVSLLDIRNGAWSRILDKPMDMYFKQCGNGIYVFHSLNRYEDQKLLGGLSVCINREVWQQVSDILKSESESSVFLINDEGEMLSGSTETESSSEIQAQLRSLDLQHSELEFRRTKSYFYFMKRVGDGQLTVVKTIPLETITKSVYATITAGILTGSLFAAVSVLLAILVSLWVSRPIVSLARTMRMAQIQNFEMKPVQSRDEIGLLEQGYNSMMQRIKELIKDEYQKNIELKNAQLMALQAQINPHFLNNTLNLIGGMALSKNAPEIYQITRVIGDLLRYSISTEGDMVSLGDELKHMQNYIFIQEHRFVGRCTVMVSMDETVLDSKLPKFTLQPIVENAFEHGLQHKEGDWKVKIVIRCIGNRIGIMVKDNGIGITGERIKQVRAELQSGLSIMTDRTETNGAGKRRGIGLRNVNARLKLQFGNGYGARIFSKPGAGTLIVLVLPVTKGEAGDNV